MNFLEKTLATLKFKSAVRKGDYVYHARNNMDAVRHAILTRQFEAVPGGPLTSAEAAAWFTKEYDGSQALYVLTHTEEGSHSVRAAILVSDAPEVTAFTEAKVKGADKGTLEKCTALAGAAIICKIDAIKDRILGYTLDSAQAEAFATSLDPDKGLSIDSDIETLCDAWRQIKEGMARGRFLRTLLGKYQDIVPSNVMISLSVSSTPPFGNVGWAMILHQIKLGRPIDQAVFEKITESDVLKSCLGNGKKLEGLDFSGQTQAAIIVYAVQNNRNLNMLKNGEVWKSAEEMRGIYETWKNQPVTYAEADDGGEGLYYGDAYYRERDLQQRKEQSAAINRATNAVYDAQIAQLRSQLEVAELDYRNQRITALELGQIRESIKRQIEDLKRKKV